MRGCQIRSRCKFWSHHQTTGKCHLKDGTALKGRMRDTSFFSGPKTCEDTKYSGRKNYWTIEFVHVQP